MKYILSFVLIVLGVASTAFSQSAKQVAGAYQNCLSHCETYNIKADLKFDYLLDGDLYNNERTAGTWEFVGPNKIHLKSPKKKLIRKVEERSKKKSDSIRVTVFDPEGFPFSSTVYLFLPDENGTAYRSENSQIVIPRTSEFTISAERSSESYKIENAEADEIDIEIEAWLPPVIDETFTIEKGKICLLTDDGQRGYCLRKISSKRTEELFPEK